MEVLKESKGAVKNVRKVVDFGITFDSRLEHYAYKSFKEANLNFDFKPTYTLIEKFKYMGESIRTMTLTPDFRFTTDIVDTKGYMMPNAQLKYKLLKKYLYDRGESYRIIFLKNQIEVREYVSAAKSGVEYKPKVKKKKS